MQMHDLLNGNLKTFLCSTSTETCVCKLIESHLPSAAYVSHCLQSELSEHRVYAYTSFNCKTIISLYDLCILPDYRETHFFHKMSLHCCHHRTQTNQLNLIPEKFKCLQIFLKNDDVYYH